MTGAALRCSVIGIVAVAAAGRAQEPTPPLRLVQSIRLEGVEGRLDHLAYDAERGRLFVAALGNGTLEVIDVASGARLRQIGGLQQPSGVAFVPDAGRVAVATAGDGRCQLFDASLALVGSVDALEDADNVRYDAAAKRLWVGYGEGALAAVDPERGVRLASVALRGHPEAFVFETEGPRIFVNVPAAREVAVVDRARGAVVAAWPIGDAAANFPLALDEAGHRLFVATRRPARLLVMDTDSGRVSASVPSCGDADDLFYDAALGRVYLAGGEGCLDVFDAGAAGTRRLETVATAPGARTALFAPALRRLFLAVPRGGRAAAELRVFAAP